MKIKRVLAFVLAAVLVLCIMPLTVAAKPSSPPPSQMFDYTVTVKFKSGWEVVKTYEIKGKEWILNSKTITVNAADEMPAGYILDDAAEKSVTVNKSNPSRTIEFKVKKLYPYTVTHEYYLDNGPTAVKIEQVTGMAPEGSLTLTALPKTIDGIDYSLRAGEKLNVTVRKNRANNFTLKYDGTTPPPPPPQEYAYSITYVFHLNGVEVGSTTIDSGSAIAGTSFEIDDAHDFSFDESGAKTYTRGPEEPETVTISEEGSNAFIINFYRIEEEEPEEPEEPEETPPVNVPPQVILNTPTPTIEVPEEEIPTTVPDEAETDIEEEEFEDEEIPTDVPETGDSSPIYTALALIALAGAAFVLTLKRSRNIG